MANWEGGGVLDIISNEVTVLQTPKSSEGKCHAEFQDKTSPDKRDKHRM